MVLRASFLGTLSLLVACGGASPPPVTTTTSAVAETVKAEPDDRAPRPEKSGPPELAASEKSELSSTCSPLLTAMIEGESQGLAILDGGLRDGAAEPDEPAVAAALARVKQSPEGLSSAEHQRCLALFEKQQRRKQFEHDPAEAEARAAVDRCVKSVESAYGKQSMSFDEGGGAVAQGPFCPDDFPVPQKLAQLPYQSTKGDWDTPAWRCLQFGLRTKQQIQVEYSAPIGAHEFTCAARYYPRQGGAPVEYFRGGKQGPEGQLLLAPKMMRRKLAPSKG